MGMQRFLIVAGFVAVSTWVSSPAASAQSIPTCAQLNDDPAYGLAGNPVVVAHSTTLISGNVPFCQVDFIVSERGGPAYGYAVGQNQRIALRVGLPVNTADGGSGGGPDGQGAWNGKVRNLGGGGLVGAVGSVATATNSRYVGSSTDSGHTTAENSGFGVIQETHELNLGKIEDFFSESLRLQYQWALRLVGSYYGQRAIRNYWDGCSTGGRQGLVLASRYGQDFDGFLIGAPHTNHSRTSSAGAWRNWVNLEITGGTVDNAKMTAAVNRMIAACDADDGVVDGFLSDPRTCRASATLNICGQPGAPVDATCLTPPEAKVIEMAFDGPRNDTGQRVWVPYGKGAAVGMGIPTTGTGGNDIFGYAAKDMTYDWRLHPLSDWDDIHELGTTTVGPYIDMSTPDLDLTRNNGGKILMWHGLADQLIPWQQNVYYYNKVLDNYNGLDNVTPWFRFFLAPGVTHCGGGVGPQPQSLFDTLVNWRENGVAPDSIASAGGGRTRPLCPFPQTAIYDGVGDPNLASSFRCGGNLETKEVKCNGLLVKYQHETGTAYEAVGDVDALKCRLSFAPVTTAQVRPRPVLGVYFDEPAVTLTARDRDSDLDHSEYQIDGGGWTLYEAPFKVNGIGKHLLEYRSVDKAGNVEEANSLTLTIRRRRR
jgi:hypothetical protein